MPDLRYRPATAEDVGAVVALVQSAYRGADSIAGWTTEAGLLDGQRIDAAMAADLVATPDVLVLLAHEGATLQACCELRAPDTAGGTGYFGMFAVRPGLQGSGYGRLVLAEAERLAATRLGAGTLEMTVIRQRVELIRWYERRGYARTGEVRPFPYGDTRFGVPRRDDLEFLTLAKPLTTPLSRPRPEES